MSIETLCIPQLGEGLQEAMLVEYLCQPGAWIRRDQPIYVMETDKATTEVESPVEGRLIGWLVEPGQVLPIGFAIGRIELQVSAPVGSDQAFDAIESAIQLVVDAETTHQTSQPTSHTSSQLTTDRSQSTSTTSEATRGRRFRVDTAHAPAESTEPHRRHREDGVRVPPRTKRHLAALGLSDQFDRIPSRGPKLMPEDVDRFVAAGQRMPPAPTRSYESAFEPPADLVPKPIDATPTSTGWYDEGTVPKSQLTLNYRLLRGLQQVVPATAIVEVDWTRIGQAREMARETGGPTGFQMMLWCVARSLAEHAALRSTLVRDGRVLRTYRHVDLGVAVALPDDRLVTAVIPQADTLTQSEFWKVAADRIAQARTGRDQANDRVTFTVSNVGTFGLQLGVPVVVPPAVATLALGEVEKRPVPHGDSWRFEPRASLALTFDHRVLNGLGAGRFLGDLRRRIAEFTLG